MCDVVWFNASLKVLSISLDQVLWFQMEASFQVSLDRASKSPYTSVRCPEIRAHTWKGQKAEWCQSRTHNIKDKYVWKLHNWCSVVCIFCTLHTTRSWHLSGSRAKADWLLYHGTSKFSKVWVSCIFSLNSEYPGFLHVRVKMYPTFWKVNKLKPLIYACKLNLILKKFIVI